MARLATSRLGFAEDQEDGAMIRLIKALVSKTKKAEGEGDARVRPKRAGSRYVSIQMRAGSASLMVDSTDVTDAVAPM